MSDIIYALTNCGETYFAAHSAGLLRSLDRGGSWLPVLVGKEAAMPVPASVVSYSPYVALPAMVFAAVPGGILRSPDDGTTWESAQLPGPAPFITALAFSSDFEVDRTMFAASFEDGVFRSTDGGASWAAWNFGLLDLQVLGLVSTSENNLYAGTGTGLFVSQNGGRAWREVLLPCGFVPILSIASRPGLLLVGTEGSGLYVSADNAQSWQRLGDDNLESANGILQEGDALLVMTLDALYLSRDAGRNWRVIPGLADDESPSQMMAADGLRPGAWLVVGCSNGELRRLELP